jgi:hypothetical protein
MPSPYNAEEDEADELVLFGEEEDFGLDLEHLPRRQLSDFSIYNAEVRLARSLRTLDRRHYGAYLGRRCSTCTAPDSAAAACRPQGGMLVAACASGQMHLTTRACAGLARFAGAAAHVVGRGPGCGAVRIRQGAGRRRRVERRPSAWQ